ncbi:hypothetical protein AYO45_00085 [Gammaproteobacteria bacterium SCGC AG-212-F23]|nr:hypothetical protein AYO45_00085 [Gammaproteobacteria bacterium SCGC AG-212-F23]
MKILILLFLTGIICLQFFSYIPSLKGIIFLLIIFLLLKYFTTKFPQTLKIIIATLMGFTWVLYFSLSHLSWSVPSDQEGKTILITGQITSIPNTENHTTSFLFQLKTFNNKPTNALIKLSWRNSLEHLHAGEQWQLYVRLKKIHSLMNPGGFDYETYAFQQGIRATGYVVTKNIENKRITNHWYHQPLNRVRQSLKEKIENNVPLSNTSPWLVALALGERHGIAPENWQVLRNTGTNHLMAIAGLHIGFMSGFIFALVSWCWRRIPACALVLPAQHAGAIAALMMALIYSMLAGFSIPTQRACIMLMTFLLWVLSNKKIIAWQAWFTALLCVLLFNPLSTLDASFWLSFGSVALIIYGVSARVAAKGLWWKLGRIQWVIAIGLIPLSIWLFQQCSIVSFVANSIAIPCVGFIIVPLCLLGCFFLMISGKIGGLILLLDDKILALLWKVLAYLSQLSWSSWYQVVPEHWILCSACVGVFLLLLPAGMPGRWLGIIWMLPMFLYKPTIPKEGEAWFTLLDVGQGLASVVETRKHILVFDTGARLSDSYDMGANVVVPFLRTIAAKKIDMLVISHGDNDHIGGAKAVLTALPVSAVKTSVPEMLPTHNTSYCLRGESWRWDGVEFSFLSPVKETLNQGNDSSCVLRIRAANKTVLFTGDIEKSAEKFLVENEKANLSADILVAPHHGSKTSGLKEFVVAVHPKIVLLPLGYRNRYHFPHPQILAQYANLGAIFYDSVTAGAITYKINSQGLISSPELYRKENKKFWHND